jgi:prefoldin subunit 5
MEKRKGKAQSDQMSPTAPQFHDVLHCLQKIEGRLDKIEQKLETLDELKSKLNTFENDLKRLWTIVEDRSTLTNERLKSVEDKVDSIEFSQDKLYDKVSNLEAEKKSLKDEVTYLQSQSMRNNLVFANIEESERESNTETEAKLRKFLVEKMNIAQDYADKLILERVHRMGVSRQGNPRSIVAKFHEFKDREYVRKQAKSLKGTRFYVNEQYPKEVADKRRKLVPRLKEAKQQGKNAWISYDTLYIDGRPVKE